MELLNSTLAEPSLAGGGGGGEGGSSATATIQEPELEMFVLADATNTVLAKAVAGSNPINVQLGEKIDVMAFVDWGEVLPPAEVDWAFPGDNAAIVSYNPNAGSNQLTELGIPGVFADAGKNVVSDSESVRFEWAIGGAQDVTMTVGGSSLTVPFNVQTPQGTQSLAMTATIDTTVLAQINPQAKLITGTGTWQQALNSGWDGLYMDPVVFTANVPSGWQYCFAQTVTSFDLQPTPAILGGGFWDAPL